jgi:hypothetical protein
MLFCLTANYTHFFFDLLPGFECLAIVCCPIAATACDHPGQHPAPPHRR